MNNLLNLEILNPITTGKYCIPTLQSLDKFIKPFGGIGFNYAQTAKGEYLHKMVHFFLDDYQFERVWNQPNKYIGVLSKFKSYILTPDFSLYTDMPLSLQIYNTYRSRWLGQFWQSKGLEVIPTISWSTKESYEFCFDGVEKGSVIATSTYGSIKVKAYRELFIDGWNEMCKRIEPSIIVCYGKKPDFELMCEDRVIWYDITK